jgi:RNA polymerase sigma-70 factor (ECF subfamily)
MERVRDGDDKAFEQLLLRHQQAVIGTIVRMTGKVKDAEDMAQQVFLRVWRSAPRYQATARFSTWLFTITRNVVFNENRRLSRRREMSIEDLSEGAPERTPADTDSTPDASLLEGELRQAIDAALARLPEKQRLALVLRRYEEMPYEDIGRILELSLPAVKSLIFRARNTLRGLLEPYLRTDDE